MRKLDGVPGKRRGGTLPPFSSSIRTLFQRFATLFYLKYVLDSGSIQLFKFRRSLALTSVPHPFRANPSLSLSPEIFPLTISPRAFPSKSLALDGSTVIPWGFRVTLCQPSQTQKPPLFPTRYEATEVGVASCKIGKRGGEHWGSRRNCRIPDRLLSERTAERY